MSKIETFILNLNQQIYGKYVHILNSRFSKKKKQNKNKFYKFMMMMTINKTFNIATFNGALYTHTLGQLRQFFVFDKNIILLLLNEKYSNSNIQRRPLLFSSNAKCESHNFRLCAIVIFNHN